MPFVRSLVLLAALAAAAPAVGDDAKSYDAATRKALQDVITHQLDAFSHDDAKAAEAFATPALQEKFPDPAKFLAMVKENYTALVRPKSTAFGTTEDSPHGPLQAVTVIAADGTVWKAIYAFEQVDGQWRISGCGLQKDDSQQAI